MDRFIALLAGESCTNLLLALAHTLWEGALAAGVLFFYLRRTPAAAANQRYAASVAALGAVVLGALLTWSILSYHPAKTARDTGLVAGTGAGDITNYPAASKSAAFYDKSSASRAGEPARGAGSRQVWLMEVWLAGVALMFLRLTALVAGGSRLRRRCRLIEDSQTLALVEQLRGKMGIGRRVRVLVGDPVSTPGVVGCFWPTLLLPASMISGIPAEDLQAILTHELAHIRRYDYLVNFLQMVVEALLFFNPAVWWISRQIRIEREACCDAAGVLWTGQRTRYAEVLVAWAQRLGASPGGTPAPGVGFAGDAGGGNILDRVRRILVAGHQPRPRVPWHIAVAMVVLTFAGVLVLQQTTSLAVALAGHILTPQERIERIGELSQKYGTPERQYGPEDRIEVSGVVRTWDSAPLPTDHKLMLEYVKRNASGGFPVKISEDGTFRLSIDYCNRFHVMAMAEGYAPAYVGPFQAEPGGRVEGIELVLEEGFRGRIRVVEEGGQPVPGAKLSVTYAYSVSTIFNLTTDANGLAILPHTAPLRLALEVDARGFEREEMRGFVLAPDKTKTVILKRARSTTGVVLAEIDGRPIAGARIRITTSTEGIACSVDNYPKGDPGAFTNAGGRFELSQLRQGRKYLLLVEASGYGYRYVPDVEAGDHDIRVVLGPKKVIRGTITGDLSLLATDPELGQPIIQATNSYEYPRFSTCSDAGSKVPVAIRNGIGYFEVADFWGQTVTLTAGPEKVRLNVETDRLDAVTIDLPPAAQRRVVLRFQVPPGGPPITGTVRIEYITTGASQHNEHMNSKRLDIQNNQASCEVPMPVGFTYGIDFDNGQRPVGYWFAPILFPIYIPPGGDPFVIDVPVHPAGAICGRILRPDGSLASNARATLITVKKSDADNTQAFPLPFPFPAPGNVRSEAVERGTFNATPLPLGGSYAIVAYEGNVLAESDTFALDEKTPIVNVDLHLPSGTDVEGRLLDADGTPARNELSLRIAVKKGEQLSWIAPGAPARPDETGRFVFKNVNPGPRGLCAVTGTGPTGYRPIVRLVENLQTPVLIQMEKGLVVTGTVIDDVTGQPVPDVGVYACSLAASENPILNAPEMLPADALTDKQGQFVFSSMAQRQYQLGLANATLAGLGPAPVVTGGQAAPIVLRVRIPEGSDLKPHAP